ncbi:MarR family winged helix-turn-helix transcriptional regulator [Chloroflexota bacterium]
MDKDIHKEAYTDQIAIVIQDFVHLWSKFEEMLHNELSSTRNAAEVDAGGENRLCSDYSLFYRISNSMYRQDSMTMGELSSALSVPMSTATRMVDWLVNGGYVQRLSDTDDRRVVRVALTDKGKQLHQTIESYTGDRVMQVVSCLTAEEQTTLFALIHKVVSELKEIAG